MPLNYVLVQAFGWAKGSVTILIGALKNIRSRKTVVLFGFFGFICLYLASSYLLPAHRHFHASSKRVHPTSCLDKYLKKWSEMMLTSDAVFKEIPESRKENRFFPFSGNGHIGFSVSKDGFQFYVMTEKEAAQIDFVPAVTHKLDHFFKLKRQAFLLNIKEGVLQALTSYVVNKSCVVVQETFYTHRLHSDVFIQEIVVRNSARLPLTVKFKQHTTQNGFTSVVRKATTKHGEVKYRFAQGNVKLVDQPEQEINVVSSVSYIQPTMKVPHNSHNKVTVLSVNKFVKRKKTEDRKRKSTVDATKDLSEVVKERLLDIVDIPADTLLKQHVEAWNDVWKVGVSINSESDPDSPSSLHVNLTEYYIYSSSIYNRSKVSTQKMECYNGLPTIHNADLWVIPWNIKTLYRQKLIWNGLFKHSGCVIDSFLFSMRESMVLSFLGLQYYDKQMQLALNPLNLLSNISIRSLSLEYFHSYDILDIEIKVNRKTSDRTLLVNCAGMHKPVIYGCSTGCDKVVELGSTTLKFSIHTTDPVTPIFYISLNRTHLEQLGQTEFMKKAKENAKTAHQSHLEVHHLKLSPKFWLAVVILIVSFHVIVVKMIYNECRKDRGSGRRRPPFSS